jgi:hypothetical protein
VKVRMTTNLASLPNPGTGILAGSGGSPGPALCAN